MQQSLYDYDIYPKVFPVGKPVEITIRGLSARFVFAGEYKIVVQRLDAGPAWGFTAWNHTDYTVEAGDDHTLRFTFTAEVECEHYVRIFKGDSLVAQLSVYALADDLAARIPLRGDFHMHTCRSDGREDPATVCANYRAIGYDFIVITDHHRYYPSLEAMEIYKNVPHALTILPGEEVHLPMTDVHIVNAGGTFSVNGLLENSPNDQDKGTDPLYRSLDGKCPAIVPAEEYRRQVEEIAASAALADCPVNVERLSFAVCLWAFDRIREAGGVGIFAHPYWLADMWQIPEAFTRYMMEKHPFDAFEVLGGENYYEQNGFQTALYYEEYRAGRIHPIVGSTDSHGSTEHNRNRDICSTIVFAAENERCAILDAVKNRYSVAVDTISKEYRLVGEFRLQKYASFLMENYFPLHDRIAAMDGELMREYILGEADASELSVMKNKAEAQRKKYFCTK